MRALPIYCALLVIVLSAWIYSYIAASSAAVRSPRHALSVVNLDGAILLELSDAAADPGLGPRAIGWRFGWAQYPPGLLAKPSSFLASIGLIKEDIRIPWDAGAGLSNSTRLAYSRVFRCPYWLIMLVALSVVVHRIRRKKAVNAHHEHFGTSRSSIGEERSG